MLNHGSTQNVNLPQQLLASCKWVMWNVSENLIQRRKKVFFPPDVSKEKKRKNWNIF